MENMLCNCEICLLVYISDLHKQINELQKENTTLKKMILQEEPSHPFLEIPAIPIKIDTNITINN